MARQILELAGGGRAVPLDLVLGLAVAVADSPAVRLAGQVLAGGPHRLDRALELAALVLRSTAADQKAEAR